MFLISIENLLEEQKLENELTYLKTQLAKKEKKLKKYKEKSQSGVDQFGKVVENGAKIVNYIKGLSSGGGSNILQGPAQQSQEEIEDSEIEIIEEETQPKKKKKHTKEQEVFNTLFEKVGEKGIKNLIRTMSILSQHPDIHQMVNQELNQRHKNKK